MQLKRFPRYTQLNASDCGPTSLRIVSKFYGMNYSSEMLRRHCYISRRGVTMQGIAECAQYIGFDTIGMKMTFEQLAADGVFPCILHWNQNHFVVCYDIQGSKSGKYNIRISDPATQRLTYEKDEFVRCWIGKDAAEESTGVVLMLEPGDRFGTVKDECKANGRSMLSFARYFTPYRSMIAQLMLAMLVSSLIQMVLPFLSQAMVDQGINGRNMGIVTLILLAQLGFFVTTLLIDYVRSWIIINGFA